MHPRTQLQSCFIFSLIFIIGVFPTHSVGAEIIVTSPTDDGFECTLREAIQQVNSASTLDNGCTPAVSSGDDTIKFNLSLPATITLSSSLPTITTNLRIIGPEDPQGLAVSGNDLHQIMSVNGSDVEIRNLKLMKGRTTGDGGALLVMNTSEVRLTSISITDNIASSGGGIYIQGEGNVDFGDSILRLVASDISNNTATGGSGGGIAMLDAQATIETSTIAGNKALSGRGGGIDSKRTRTALRLAAISINKSTLSNNHATGSGGGISVSSIDALFFNRSSISGNSTSETGGGIYIRQASSAFLLHNTITKNTAQKIGGGVHDSECLTANQCRGGIQLIENNIISGNLAVENGHEISLTLFDPPRARVEGNVIGSSLIDIRNGLGQMDNIDLTKNILVFSDQFNVATEKIVEPLSFNGGSTKTHLLAEGSPALLGTKRTKTNLRCLETDQRGFNNIVGSFKFCDIGAVYLTESERTRFSTPYIIKTKDGKVTILEL